MPRRAIVIRQSLRILLHTPMNPLRIFLALAQLLTIPATFAQDFQAGVASADITPAGPIRLAVFYSFGMYRRLWRQASIGELRQILVAGAAAAVLAAVIGLERSKRGLRIAVVIFSKFDLRPQISHFFLQILHRQRQLGLVAV